MADIIQLLPDAIANQIAAGEVVQRPASVVKELLENAVDAGSTNVKLIIKDAGKTLIQVIDNGSGMTETDARLSFERHATSKIRLAKDLFNIRTMGFRGEALASIASVAQVELRTRRADDELGTRIAIESSETKENEPCQCTVGSNFSVRNLFFNVPARRAFLKSDPVELRHILDEFQHVALAYPQVFFSLHNNGSEMFHLPSGALRQRVVGIFGKNYNNKIVPVQEDTDVVRINGFVGKPEAAKRQRGEQFFFVNQRFIKSGYLHHAILTAFEELLPKEMHPFYVLFIDIDPARIDVNVHPTKQEIKFDDERIVYNYLKVAVRHALAQHSVAPTLDFEQDANFGANGYKPTHLPANFTPSDGISDRTGSQMFSGSGGMGGQNRRPFNPSEDEGELPPMHTGQERHDNNAKNWQDIFAGLNAFDTHESKGQSGFSAPDAPDALTLGSGINAENNTTESGFNKVVTAPSQIHSTYIISQIKSGFMLIDQQAAHERILTERYQRALDDQQLPTQQLLFPKTLTFGPADAELLRTILDDINRLGFDLQEFGTNTFILHGTPSVSSKNLDEQALVEGLLNQYKDNIELRLDAKEKIAAAMARSTAVRRGQRLTVAEMQELIDQLFACDNPYRNPFGRACFVTYDLDDIAKQFV